MPCGSGLQNVHVLLPQCSLYVHLSLRSCACLTLLPSQVAIMSEIGWHIQQDWYYREEYNILNMGFYFFLTSGLSAWAFGLRLNQGEAAAAAAADMVCIMLCITNSAAYAGTSLQHSTVDSVAHLPC
jgi:hypothetical protein